MYVITYKNVNSFGETWKKTITSEDIEFTYDIVIFSSSHVTFIQYQQLS